MTNVLNAQVSYETGKCYRGSVKFLENGDICVRPYEPSENKEDRMHLVMSKGDNNGNSWDIYESKNVFKLAVTVKKENLKGLRKWTTFAITAARLFKNALGTINKFKDHD